MRVEIALSRAELEVPDELWSAEHNRVDEQKISSLTAVHQESLQHPTVAGGCRINSMGMAAETTPSVVGASIYST